MEIVYWNEKIKDFINDLDRETRARIFRVIDQLERYGNMLDMPDSKSLGKGLFELRTQGKVKVRLLYIFQNHKAYFLHAFVKKAWKINVRDIRHGRHIQQQIIRLA